MTQPKRYRLPKGFKRGSTPRGFQTLQFKDWWHENQCSIQVSSACYKDQTNSALWLSCALKEGDTEGRMHLSLDQVKALVKVFQHWIDTGEM